MPKRDSKNKTEDSGANRYGDELLRANWNPMIDLLQSSSGLTQEPSRPAPAEQVSDEEAAALMNRIYKLGY
ncbi:MAG TPA: hypothetical protein VFI62_04890 [Burkholderiales bacterium]|nr:hypothetical protein [Burkholderiales bacterium]